MKQNLRFGVILGLLAVLKNSVILLKYSTFEGIFHIFMGKTNTKLEFLYIVASARES